MSDDFLKVSDMSFDLNVIPKHPTDILNNIVIDE